jgi:hypothetical protein
MEHKAKREIKQHHKEMIKHHKHELKHHEDEMKKHGDVKEDKALIKKMVKKNALK